MVTYIDEKIRVSVPFGVSDIEGFRLWTESPDFPEHGQIWWLCGEVWVDMSKEQIFSHVAVKTEITRVLGNLAKQGQLGMYLTDGVLLSNFAADISGNPDGLFLLNDTLSSDRVRLIEGKEGGFVELQGSPDMVLEIVSHSSVDKDTVTLRKAYWEAGVREYWIADARNEAPKFDILRRGAKNFILTRKADGWIRSTVFGNSFRLTRTKNSLGHPDFTLEVR